MAENRLDIYADAKSISCVQNDKISDKLFREYGVFTGLRDENGKGVLTGLTRISEVKSFADGADGKPEPCDGELWYRGYNVNTLLSKYIGKNEFGFERMTYLLLFGELPSSEQEAEFKSIIGDCRILPSNFTRDVIMKAPTGDIMNSMSRSILALAAYDTSTGKNDVANTIKQCIKLISLFPSLAVYAYHAYNHYINDDSMYIHRPDPSLSAAENLLMMLRPNKKYSFIEAKVLDTALILHMEHGGGNNSTFTTRVVTSSGSDAYSTMAAAMSSLKGPKHGGANIKVMEMMNDIKQHVNDITSREEVSDYLHKIVNKEAFDGKGLNYGMGHAVYTVSDPRERILKEYVKKLSADKHKDDEMTLYGLVEELAPSIIEEKRRTHKAISPNVDFYSGFVYDMLGIPKEMYTAIFAIARIVGWSAHRLEELICTDKIIRPAYMSVMKEKE